MNMSAHRRPSAVAGPPCLVWHRAFWNKSLEKLRCKPEDDEIYPTERDLWVRYVDQFLYRLFLNLKEHDAAFIGQVSDKCYNVHNGTLYLFEHMVDLATGSTRRVNKDKNEDEGSYEYVSVEFKWHGLPVKLRAGRQFEFFTLSVFVDLSKYNDDTNPEFRRYAQAFTKVTTEDCKEAADTASLLYDQVWCQFEREIVTNIPCTPGQVFGPELAVAEGCCFVDFRGVVIGASEACDAPKGELQIKPTAFPPRNPGSLSDYIGKREFSDECAHKIVESVWKFVTAEEQLHRIRHESSLEYIVTSFLKRRALYVTSMAPQPAGDASGVPLRYLVVSASGNRWQIGRLVDRLHTMGTSRLAALKDLRALKVLSDKLREAGAKSEILLQKAKEFRLADNGADQRKTLDDWRKQASSLSGMVLDAASACEGGAQYRVERSQHYKRSFLGAAEFLREEKIEGFSRYVGFVHRRLFSTYEFIRHVGVRLDRVNGTLNAVSHTLQTNQDMLLQSVITKRHDDALALQTFAEYAAIVPISYYGGTMIYHAAEAFGAKDPALHASAYLLAAIAFGILAYSRARERRKSREVSEMPSAF